MTLPTSKMPKRYDALGHFEYQGTRNGKVMFVDEVLAWHAAEMAALEAKHLEEVRAERERCARAVIESCSACGGLGYTTETRIVAGHGCGGDEALCARICPIEIQEPEQVPCEYCGRPADAIRNLSDTKGEGK